MRLRSVLWSLVAIISVLVIATAFVAVRRGFSARDEPSWVEKVIARRVRAFAVPARARDAKNPVSPTPEALRKLKEQGVNGGPLDPETLPPDLVDLLASFQRAIVTALVDRVETVHRAEGIRTLALSGGVAANSELRRTLSEWGTSRRVRVLLPERGFTTDNGAMIAFAGLLHYRREGADDPAAPVAARSRWPLGSISAAS